MDLTDRTLGEFHLTALIGEGGYGQVYRANQAGLDRDAVVKVLGVDARARASAVERFLREAKLASRLDHPYAAHVYAFGVEPDGLVWIAMELVRGTPLDRLLEHAPLALDRAVPFLIRLCEVVQTAHDQGIVHRDLKPANVMVISRAGSVFPKLIDLGIALETGDREADKGKEPVGTPFYMAPEQWAGSSARTGPPTDIYALGVLTFEVLTGRPPFDGDSVLAVAVQHARAKPPKLPDGFAPELDTAIARAMAKRPAERFGSAMDLAAALGEAAGVGGEVVPPPRLDEAIRQHAMARSPQPIAEAIAVLDAAANPHQAQIALHQLVRAIAQYVGLLSLAARTRSGPGRRSDSRVAVDLIRGLRRGRLEVGDWWQLARELCRPFAAIADAHPIPELVELFFAGGEPRPTTAMDELVTALAATTTTTADDARRGLAETMPRAAAVLGSIRFLDDYTVVVPATGTGEIWMGVRPPRRTEIAIDRAVEAGRPLLVGADRRPVVSLWPLVQAAPPTPNAPPELFLLDGTVRGSACLVASPHGFERHDDTVWDWLGARLGGIEGFVATGASEEVAPYHGLTAFQETDADAFLGREREVETLTNRLRAAPLIAIVGPSGVGKSSFIRAGVLPALAGAGPVKKLVLRPGHAPLSGLSVQVGALGEPCDAEAIAADPELVGARLRAYAEANATSVVVVVDQFEELFTLCRDANERTAYARALCAAARAAEDPIRVILTLRDDFLVRASALPVLRERLAASLHVCTTPAREDLLRILVEPARRAGYEFEEATLLDEMVEAVVDRPGALALLSFTALQLWELRDRHFRVLPRKAYTALGGVGGALGRHAEQTLAAMSTEQQRLVRIAFRHLVTAEGTRAVIGEADLVAALAGSASDPQVGRNVVERLIDARVVVVSEDERGEQRIEIAHEALLAAWPRLAEWQREDADGVRFRDHLRAAAKQWEERGRPRGLLWRGDALLEYQLWRTRYRDPLAAREDEFARASETEASRSRRLRRAALATLVVAMAVVSIVLWRLSARATAAAAEAEQRELAALIEQGRQAVIDGDSASALMYLSEAYNRGSRGAGVRYMLARAHRAAAAYQRVAALDPPTTDATTTMLQRESRTLTLSPDGEHVVTTGGRGIEVWEVATGRELPPLAIRPAFPPVLGGDVVAMSTDAGVLLWDPAAGTQRVVAAGLVKPFVAISADGGRLLLAHDDGERRLLTWWDVATDRADGEVVLDVDFRPPQFLADGRRFALITADKTLRAFDPTIPTPLINVPVELADIGNADPTGHRILTYDNTGEHAARLWDVAGVAPPVVMHGHDQAILIARISPDGSRVVTGSRDRTVKVWDAATGRLLLDLTRHRGVIEGVAFSGDGRRILSRATDHTARVWDTATGLELMHLSIPDLRAAVITADGEHVLTATMRELKTWPVRHPDLALELPHGTTIPIGAAFSLDGTRMVTEDRRQVIRIWNRATGALERELPDFDLGDDSHQYLGLDISRQRKLPAFDPASARVFAPVGNQVAIWTAATGARAGELAAHTALVSSVRVARDGATLVTAGQDGLAIVWDAAKLTQLAVLHEDGAPPLMYAELSPDGELVLTASYKGVSVWRWRTATRVHHFDMALADSAAFSPDGDRIVASGRDSRVVVWATADGHQVAATDTGSSSTRAVRFATPDLLVTTNLDGFARVLDAATMIELGRFGIGGSEGTDRWAEVSPDGGFVALVGADSTARVWSIEPETAAPAAIATFTRCELPLALDHSRIVPRALDRTGCAAR